MTNGDRACKKEYIVVDWSDDKKQQLLHYIRKGFSIREIAAYFNTTYESVASILKRMRACPKWRGVTPDLKRSIVTAFCEKVGVFDIETSNLNSNRGFLLTYVIKEYGKNKYYKGVISQTDLRRGLYDKNLVKKLIADLKNFDALIGYFSSGFDIPFIRGRAVRYNLPFPHFGTIKQLDLFFRVKYKYGLSRNSLAAACEMCGIKGKTHIDMSVWQDAAVMGCRKSLAKILAHNIADVKITERLYDRIKNYSKDSYKSI